MAARSRGDSNEEEDLLRTAPRAVYSGVTISFYGMIRGRELATWAVVIDVLNAGVGRLSVLAVGNTWIGEEAARNAITESAKQVVAVWDSLDLFCQSVGVSRLDATKLAPCPPIIEPIVELAQHFVVSDGDSHTARGSPENAETAPLAPVKEIPEISKEYATLLQTIWEREAGIKL